MKEIPTIKYLVKLKSGTLRTYYAGADFKTDGTIVGKWLIKTGELL